MFRTARNEAFLSTLTGMALTGMAFLPIENSWKRNGALNVRTCRKTTDPAL
jgi:hypothetical protein